MTQDPSTPVPRLASSSIAADTTDPVIAGLDPAIHDATHALVAAPVRAPDASPGADYPEVARVDGIYAQPESRRLDPRIHAAATTPAINPNSPPLTHFNDQGEAHMVDVSAKPETHRTATAKAGVHMRPETRALIATGTASKGDVLAVARLAGIMAAKRTADLIPLCHPLPITAVTLDLTLAPHGVDIEATVRTTGRTGVEMEALTAASIAALTVYDMLKAVDRAMHVENLRVTHKDGGKSGAFENA